ncbi:MAG: class I SAM-dependent methyltransferase [Acidimicrobiia bacterium]
MDRSKIKAFMEQFEGLVTGATAIGALAIADRSGVLEAMRGAGWLTVAQLANDRFAPRYVEEILSVLAAVGVLDYEPESSRFLLPDEHAACLADPDSPYLLAGWLDMLPAAMKSIDDISRATVHGSGIPLNDFDDRVVIGIDRLNSPGTRILLTKRWLPAMPDVVAILEAGGKIADVGCGSGTAALAMAAAYPQATVFGYDIDDRALAEANRRARESGLKNIAFARLPAADLPTGFDLVTTFDVIHDLSHPIDALRGIRSALASGGTYLMVEPAAAPNLEGNFNSRGAMILGISLLYCLPQALVGGGIGLGAGWGPHRAKDLCRQVGFSRFEQLDIDNPYSNFYRVGE